MPLLEGGACVRESEADLAFVLSLVRRDLEEVISPALTDPDARWSSRIAARLLAIAEGRLDPLRASTTLSGVATARQELDALLTQLGAATTEGALATARSVGAEDRLWARLVALTEAEDRHALGGSTSSTAEAFAEAGAGAAAAAQETPHHTSALTADLLTTFAHDHLPDHGSAQVRTVVRTGAGTSKEVVLVELDGAPDPSWVVRRDLPFSGQRVTVADEYPLLQFLHRRGQPVARPLWYVPPGGPLGLACFAAERLDGSSDATWLSDPQRAEAVTRASAHVLAGLHTVGLDQMPVPRQPLPGSVGNDPAERVEHLHAYWTEVAAVEDPLVPACFAWLRDHAPAQDGRRSVVHGDFGPHNLLVAGTVVTGVLDWEFARAGDPHEDLAYLRPFLERAGQWATFVAAYQESGGCAPDPNLLHYYQVLATFRLALGSFAALRAVHDHDTRISLRKVNSGQVYGRRLLLDAADLIRRSPENPSPPQGAS